MNQIKAGAVLNYVIIGLNTLAGLLYTPFMLRCLGQNEYGLYSLIASVIAYLTLLDLGFGNAIVRYTAKYRAEGKKEEQWKMFGMFIVIYSVIGVIAFLGGLSLYFNVDALFDRTMTTEELSQARIMMLLLTLNLAFTFPLSIYGAIISAYENFVFQRIVSILRILLSTGVLIVVLLLGYKAVALVVVHSIFNLLTLLVNVFYCKHKLKIKVIFSKFDWHFVREVGIYSFWIFLNAIVEKIYWGTGQFVLGTLIGTAAVAIFSVAILLEQMYVQFSAAIASVLLPKITSMVVTHNNAKELSNLFLSTGRIQSIILSLILSGFIVFGSQFINIWAGTEYQQSYIITLIFFISLYIPLIQNTGVTILQARNDLRFRSLTYVALSVLSLLFQVVLTKIIGIMGCAIGVAGGMLLGQGVIMNIYYNKYHGIEIIKFWKSILHINIIPLLVTIVGLCSMRLLCISTYSHLFVCIIIFLISYIPLIYFFGMNSYEKNLVMKPIRKILKIR